MQKGKSDLHWKGRLIFCSIQVWWKNDLRHHCQTWIPRQPWSLFWVWPQETWSWLLLWGQWVLAKFDHWFHLIVTVVSTHACNVTSRMFQTCSILFSESTPFFFISLYNLGMKTESCKMACERQKLSCDLEQVVNCSLQSVFNSNLALNRIETCALYHEHDQNK